MSPFEPAPVSGLALWRAAWVAVALGGVLVPIAAGAQGTPAAAPGPAPAPVAAPAAPAKPPSGTPDTAAATSPGGPAGDASRLKDRAPRTSPARARQRLRECRAEASKRSHLWGLARVKFIKRCRRSGAHQQNG